MNSRQSQILTVLSSIAAGTMAFCLTLPVVILLGVILLIPFLPMESAVFFLQNSPFYF